MTLWAPCCFESANIRSRRARSHCEPPPIADRFMTTKPGALSPTTISNHWKYDELIVDSP
jgi:hypothetical protein